MQLGKCVILDEAVGLTENLNSENPSLGQGLRLYTVLATVSTTTRKEILQDNIKPLVWYKYARYQICSQIKTQDTTNLKTKVTNPEQPYTL